MTLGAHWHVLQSLAWARMLVQYSRSGSFIEAVQKTFDGKHRCSLCLQIRSGRQQQEREDQKLPSLKTELSSDLFWQATPTSAPIPPADFTDAVPFVPWCLRDLPYSPPTPPPRA